MSGLISPRTSTMVEAGRISRKNSPWALPTCCQWAMSVTKMRVRVTYSIFGACLFQGAFDLFEDETGLAVRVAFGDNHPFPDRRSAGHFHHRTDADGPRITDDRFPGVARGNAFAFCHYVCF